MNAWTVPALVVRVIDGDTLIVRADLGWRVELETAVRIDGINAPELSTPEGKTARDALSLHLPSGCQVEIVSKKLLGGFEKYGRVLADVMLAGESIGGWMLVNGYARVYP